MVLEVLGQARDVQERTVSEIETVMENGERLDALRAAALEIPAAIESPLEILQPT